ncbi:MAG: ATPase [Lachnospiraceae bacterium]|nr:ATPase [Lachnospiraceae bacterium]
MSSKIETIIEEIEEYIDSCKPSPFSSSKISVNRDELDSLLEELKTTTPEEIRKYQKLISNKEAILADARAKADAILAEAQIQTNELISEHQIMLQAYAQANEVVMIATKQGEEILNNATEEANNLKFSAMAYTDQLLRDVEEVLLGSIDTARMRNENFINTLQGYLNTVQANREDLRQEETPAETVPPAAEPEVPELDVPTDLLKK